MDVSGWKVRGNKPPSTKMWSKTLQILGDRRYYEEQTQTFGIVG